MASSPRSRDITPSATPAQAERLARLQCPHRAGLHHDADKTQMTVFMLALINNGFNILNTDPFYKDLTPGLRIVAAVGISAAGRRR